MLWGLLPDRGWEPIDMLARIWPVAAIAIALLPSWILRNRCNIRQAPGVQVLIIFALAGKRSHRLD
jgi:hypothetical protein